MAVRFDVLRLVGFSYGCVPLAEAMVQTVPKVSGAKDFRNMVRKCVHSQSLTVKTECSSVKTERAYNRPLRSSPGTRPRLVRYTDPGCRKEAITLTRHFELICMIDDMVPSMARARPTIKKRYTTARRARWSCSSRRVLSSLFAQSECRPSASLTSCLATAAASTAPTTNRACRSSTASGRAPSAR